MQALIKEMTAEKKLIDYRLIDGTEDLDYFTTEGYTDEQEVEQNDNGDWYVKGYLPVPTTEEKAVKVRAKRDLYLEVYVDPIVSNPLRWADLSEKEQQDIVNYRLYLLNIPEQSGFPNIEVLTFEEWSAE
ncbi:MAG: hypothetical protein J6W96_01625 [Alphaproteobacteria bacterium]|nr:hypothetical protein [Alphaproteobacteria bacterium]